MAKRLKIDLDSQDFNKAIEGANKLDKALEEIIKTEKVLLDQTKKLTKAIDLNKNLAKGIKEVESAQKQLSASQKNISAAEQTQIRNKREIVKLEIEQERRIQAKTRTSIQARKEQERQAKIAQKLKAAAEKLSGAYAKESKRLNDLRKRYKDLILAEGGATNATRKLKNEISALDNKLKKVDADVGQFQRSVGNYKQALTGSLGTVGQFATGAGAIGASVLLAGKAISSAVNIIKEFEQSNANLQAVLGVTRDEMQPLIDQAKQLGASTAFSASEVTSLNTELAKLGFPIRDIQLMAESTLNAATAMGSDLGEQAALTGATLKAFGLDASEAGRVNDVLSKATSASALDFQKLASSMSTIAPVANAFGFSVEGTTALLGQLSNAGFDASSAATATRNILLNLADSSSKLGKSLKEPVTDLPSLVKGLKQLKGEGVDLGEALELTDKRSVAAFSTFLEGADDVLTLNDALLNAGGTAEEMARVQLDTLDGSLKILNSSWEGFILSMEDGSGVMTKLTRIVIDDLSVALSTFGGDLNATNERFSYLSLLVTNLKTAFTAIKSAIKLLTLPWQVFIDLVGRAAKRFGLVSDSVGGLKEALLGIQSVMIRIPAIMDIVTDGIITSVKKMIDVFLDFGRLVKESLNFRKIITEGLSASKQAYKKLGETITDAFGQGIGGIKEKVLALWDLPNNKGAIVSAEDLGKELGGAVSDGVEKGLGEINGLIEKQIKLLSKLREEKLKAGNEQDIKTANAKIEVAQKELDRLVSLGKKQKELNDGSEEAAFKLAVFRRELAIKEGEDFEQRIQDEINLVSFKAEEELKVEGLLSDEIKLIKEKREADINEIARRADEERRKLREEEKEDIFKNASAIATFLTNLERKRNKDKIDAIDSEIEASKEQQKALRQAAIDGVSDAKDNLAIAEQLEAEAQERKRQELKKQKREELGLVYLKLVASHAEAGDKNPVLSATTDLIKTQAFISALEGFHDGTDNTGDRGVLKDEHGVITGYTHKNEIVFSENERSQMGNDSRDNIIKNYQLAERLKAGDFEKAHNDLTVVNQYQSNDGMLKAFKSLENEVRKNRPPTLVPQFNEYSKAMVEVIKREGRTDTYITKIGGGGITGNE